MREAYIIARSAISYRRYITRSEKERISLQKGSPSAAFLHGVRYGTTVLPAGSGRVGSDSPPGCHSLPTHFVRERTKSRICAALFLSASFFPRANAWRFLQNAQAHFAKTRGFRRQVHPINENEHRKGARFYLWGEIWDSEPRICAALFLIVSLFSAQMLGDFCRRAYTPTKTRGSLRGALYTKSEDTLAGILVLCMG